MNRFILYFSVLIICLFLSSIFNVLFLFAYSSAKEKSTGDSLTHRIKKEMGTLDALKKEINLQKQRLVSIKKKEDSIYTKLDLINRRISINEKELSLSKMKLKTNRKEKKNIVKRLRLLREEINKTKKVLGYNMRDLYKRGRFSSIKTLFSADSFTDFLIRLKYSRRLAESDAELIERKKNQEEELEKTKTFLLTTEKKIKNVISNISKKKKTALKEKKSKRALLKNIAIKKEVYLRHKKEAEESAEKLLALIESLEEARKRTIVEGKKIKNFSGSKGSLPWPVMGRIVSHFGKIRNPKFNVYTFNNGIEIRSELNDEIRAVYDGEIIFSDWFRGYGRLIILDNGGGYYTLYGHLNEISAEAGMHVTRGQTIGKAGETDSIHGNTLYFEIRKKGRPVDPLKWLARVKQ